MTINNLIDEAWRNAETYTREEQEGYREVYIEQEDFEKSCYAVAKNAIYEFEDALDRRLGDLDLTDLYLKSENEIGI